MLALKNSLYSSRICEFIDSDAEVEGVDAPFSRFAVDGFDFVSVDEAGFHDEGLIIRPDMLTMARGG